MAIGHKVINVTSYYDQAYIPRFKNSFSQYLGEIWKFWPCKNPSCARLWAFYMQMIQLNRKSFRLQIKQILQQYTSINLNHIHK